MSSVVNLVQARAGASDGELFAEWSQLRQVMAVVIPTAIYVVVIPFIGIYLASVVLIAVFMMWLGHYALALTLADRDRRAAS